MSSGRENLLLCVCAPLPGRGRGAGSPYCDKPRLRVEFAAMMQPLLAQREYLELLGPALHLLRQRLHLRQQEIAERAAITMARYSLYECGARR